LVAFYDSQGYGGGIIYNLPPLGALNNVNEIKPNRIRWMECVGRVEEVRYQYKILGSYPMGTGGSFLGSKAAGA
jgi:hypothetical protein